MTTTSTPDTSNHTSFFSWFLRISLTSFLLISVFLFFYLSNLDEKIRTTFKGKRWDIPARVYANPLDLYVGLKLAPNELEDLLRQLHYRRERNLTDAGGFYRHQQNIVLRTRPFEFWDSARASQHLKLSFQKNIITAITDLTTGEAIPITRLEPVQIGSFYPERKEDRVLIKFKDAPEFLIQGLLATEDRNFYEHHGISLRSIARAMWANMRAGKFVQGGSTITQQLIKNFYLSSERSLKRKINEVFLALLLELNYDKEEIFEAYLNEIYLGQDGASAIHGFGLASEFYFGRTLQDLDLSQIAALVALVRGPSYYDLRRNPKRALMRRNLVLDKMLEVQYITAEQLAIAKEKALKTVERKHRSVNRYPSFLDLVKRQLAKHYPQESLTTEGLKIFTTLDTRVQDALEVSVKLKLKDFEMRKLTKNLETAVIVTRRESGEIVALMGGRNPAEAGFNRALDANRQIGSLVKPAVYLTALSHPKKYTLTTWIQDTPIKLKLKDDIWKPQNYDKQAHGIVSLHSALTHSYNLATVNIGLDIGLDKIIKTLHKLGIENEIKPYPSLLLGALPLSPFEVTQMYQTLAGDGFFTPLRAIRAVVSKSGETLNSYPFTLKQTVNPAATYLTNTIMQSVMQVGTGQSAYKYLPKDFALVGKTGTTNKYKDSWFSGYSGDYLTTVWIGRDDNKSVGLTGATGALQLWNNFMQKVAKQKVNLIAPARIEKVWIDPSNGMLASPKCENVQVYPYISGSIPTKTSPCVQARPEIIETIIEKIPVDAVNTWINKVFDIDVDNPEASNNPNQPESESEKSWFEDFF